MCESVVLSKKLMSAAVIMPETVTESMEADSRSFCFQGFQSPEECRCQHTFHYRDSFLLTALAFLDRSIWYVHDIFFCINSMIYLLVFGNFILQTSPSNHHMNHLITKPTNGMCTQRRLRSAWATAQSDQSLCCLPEESLGPKKWLPCERTTKTLFNWADT